MTIPSIRAASDADLSDVALLMDIAGHGLINRMWTAQTAPGRSALEMGRERLRTRSDLPSFIGNWRVAVIGDAVAGGFAGYRVPDPYDPGDVSGLPAFYAPLLALEAVAAGNWHLIALAVFAEHRSRGVGALLLENAERTAMRQGCQTVSIIANSSNRVALNLYESRGYREVAQRPATAFEGEPRETSWRLLNKGLDGDQVRDVPGLP